MLRSPPATRYNLVGAYLLFAAAGLAAAFFPSPVVEETSRGGLILAMWVAFLLAGGLVAAWGRLTGRWLGEFLGLPALVTVFTLYGLSALWSGISEARYTALPGGIALQAITALLVARWAEVNATRLEALSLLDERNATATRQEKARRLIEGGD